MDEKKSLDGRAHIEYELNRQAAQRNVMLAGIVWKNSGDNHVLEFRVNNRREMIIFSEDLVTEAGHSAGIDLVRAKVKHCLSLSKSGSQTAIAG